MVAEWRRSSTYIVGVVAAARSKVQIPENYEELSRKLLYSFPKRFQRVVTVANTYRWQARERESCGRSDEKNRKKRNLVTKKRCFNTLKLLSYNRKLWYRLRNSMKFRGHIKMIQGTAISLICDLKKNPLKKCYSSSQITESRRYDCQFTNVKGLVIMDMIMHFPSQWLCYSFPENQSKDQMIDLNIFWWIIIAKSSCSENIQKYIKSD